MPPVFETDNFRFETIPPPHLEGPATPNIGEFSVAEVFSVKGEDELYPLASGIEDEDQAYELVYARVRRLEESGETARLAILTPEGQRIIVAEVNAEDTDRRSELYI